MQKDVYKDTNLDVDFLESLGCHDYAHHVRGIGLMVVQTPSDVWPKPTKNQGELYVGSPLEL